MTTDVPSPTLESTEIVPCRCTVTMLWTIDMPRPLPTKLSPFSADRLDRGRLLGQRPHGIVETGAFFDEIRFPSPSHR
jgi:hypothetical protein